MKDFLQLGPRGETLAWGFLKKKGYAILEKNYRARFGEIDLIAEKDGVLIFFEIKTRRNVRFGLPEEAVDYRKQQKLAQVAQSFIQTKGLENKAVRFDVLSIIWDGTEEPQFSLIEDAFTLDNA
ncbi:MAG: YraN family protein [Candidatus Omnitrophica bacterium]|nr:YraN family protein [Candidatus Omnitrophota bacterium]